MSTIKIVIDYARRTRVIHDHKEIYECAGEQGSERSRLTGEEGARAGAVLMDDNLRRSNLSSPLLIDPAAYAMCAAYHPAFPPDLSGGALVHAASSPCIVNIAWFHMETVFGGRQSLLYG